MKPIYPLILLCLGGWMSPGAWACPTVEPVAALEMPGEIQVVASAPARLSASEVETALAELPQWRQVEETLIYERTFEDFVGAIAFVNRLVAPAENLGHHPDITVNYNRVTLRLTTHDAGGLTELDLQLANQISLILSELGTMPEAKN